ncbi:MAG: hypothetical protein Q4C10_07130 [Clostridia bacterium]|nr:hypothetical protein [Clostridia bacterium]
MAPTIHRAMGCVVIDDFLSGMSRLSGLSSFLASKGMRVQTPKPAGAGELLSALQDALQAARSGTGGASAVACGTGCGAALALAEQLPVERLALIDPRPPRRAAGSCADGALYRRSVRLDRFARRNLALCVSDMLVIGARQAGPGCPQPAFMGAGRFHGRLLSVEFCGGDANNLYTDCENVLKNGVYSFLQNGDFPKSLAEKSEMCIIYG